MSPAYRYDPVRSPFVGSISDLIAREGEIRARAAMESGQAWAGAAQNIGSDVSRAITTATDPKRQMENIALTNAQHEQAGQTAMRDLMTPKVPNGPQEEGAPPAAAQNPFLKQEGDVSVWDTEGLSKAMAAKGFGDLTPKVVADIGSLNDAHRKEAQARQQFGQAQTNVLAKGAGTALSMLRDHPNADPSLVVGFIGDQMTANGTFPPEKIAAVKAQLLSDPTQLQARLELLSKAGTQAPIKLGKDDVLLDPNNLHAPPLASNIVPEKPTKASLALDAATLGTPRQTPTAAASKAALDTLQKPTVDARAETARHDKEMERISALTEGKAAAAQQETARHNKAMEAAANPFGAPAGAGATGPAAQGPMGDDFLKGLQPGVAAQVKALAEGRQPFPTGMSYAKLQPLIQLVTQYDPSFDAANYTARSKARTDLTSPSGTGGKTINSLNTAIQHLGRLSDLIETENNYDIPLANAVVNPLRTAAGSTKVTNFNAVQPQAMKEIERLWRGAGGSEGDINALKDSLSKNAGRQQQREALQEFVNLVKGKLDSTEQQRDNILGPAAKDVPILFNQNKPILEKIGQRAGGGENKGPAEGTKGTVGGRAATWKTVDGKTGWYAD